MEIPAFMGHKSKAVGQTGEAAYFAYSRVLDGTLRV